MKNFDQHKIDLYLKDELSPKDKADFLKNLERDPVLKKEVQTQQQVIRHINAHGDAQLRKIVKETHEEALKKNPPKKTKLKIILAATITLALLALVLFFLNRAPKHERLYQAYYEVNELPLTSRNTNTEEQINLAADFYFKKDYENALPIFQSILSKEPMNSKICLAMGICEMELEAYTDALKTFDKLIQKNDRLYYENALWYTALIHLHENKLDLAKEKLELLVRTSETALGDKAKSLLAEIE